MVSFLFLSDLDRITRFAHDPFELRSLNEKHQIFDLMFSLFLLRFESKLSPCSNKKTLTFVSAFHS